MAEVKIGSFEDLSDITEEALRPVLAKLRDVVLKIDSKAVEVVRLGDRAATYGVGPKKMSEGYCYILPHKSWVNFGFCQGAHLPDPEGLLEGTGKNMRHVKIHSLEDAQTLALKTLIKAALAERKSALNK